MTAKTVLDRVTAVVAETLDHEGLRLELATRFVDVEGWDSVSTVIIMVALEKEFRIRFRTGELAATTTIDDLVEKIQKRLAAASQATGGSAP